MPKNRAPETLAVSAAKSNGQQALFRGKKRFFEALRLTRRALESIVSKTYSLADADFSWEISMKKILVAIDNSRYANNVLDFLTSVVAEASEKPEVTLFTVIEPSLPNEVLMRLGAAGTERFKSFAQSILTPAAEKPVSTPLRLGPSEPRLKRLPRKPLKSKRPTYLWVRGV